MKKFSVVLLAIVFVFGLAIQAGAGLEYPVDESAFAGDEPITFFVDDDGDGYNDLGKKALNTQYEDLGVKFVDDAWYVDDFLGFYLGLPHAAGNIDWSNLTTTKIPIRMEFDPPVTRVGFDATSVYVDLITVTVYGEEVVTFDHDSYWDSVSSKSLNPFIGIADPEGIEAIEISASGYFYNNLFQNIVLIDNLRFGGTPDTGSTDIPVDMEIKPPNCSGASINMRSQGVTPVVIAGSEELDVTMIDPESIELQGVAPVRSALEDVVLCGIPEPDGYWDLTLKFDTQDLVKAMEASLADGETLKNDDWPLLRLTGSLFDGNTISSSQRVSVKGKPAKESKGKQKGKK